MDLNNILENHKKWLNSLGEGKRACLRGVCLRGADLRSADLRSADLREADLESADLYRADFRGANLRGANLRSADLESADLESAKNIISIGPIGDKGRIIFAVRNSENEGIKMQAGCFWGDLEDFSKQIAAKYKDYCLYKAIIPFLELWGKGLM